MVEIPRNEAFRTSPEQERVPTTSPPAAFTNESRAVEPMQKRGRKRLQRLSIGVLLLAGVVVVTYYGHDYWTTGQFIESTDDAYVKADYTTIAPKISGYVAEVLVEDNEAVKAGQLLARVDDRDYRSALTQAQANLQAATAAVANLDAQLVLQQSVIAQAEANVAASKALLSFADADNQRYQNLIRSGAGTSQRAEQSVSTRDQAVATLQRDQAALIAEEKRIPVLQTQHDQAAAERDSSAATAQQAELNLSYTRITAPVDGVVGARTLRVGQFVTAGTQLMALVPLDAVYVVANYKETQLTYVRRGEPAEIKIDSFPDHSIKGHVDSISPASGLEFSLLPPDNATGNFTKIVQRIPVKIVIDDSKLSGFLRSGMSVESNIDTKSVAMSGG